MSQELQNIPFYWTALAHFLTFALMVLLYGSRFGRLPTGGLLALFCLLGQGIMYLTAPRDGLQFNLGMAAFAVMTAVQLWALAPIGPRQVLYYGSRLCISSGFTASISWQVYICMILLVIIDRKMAGGYGWSVTWVLPAGFVGLAIVIISVGRGLHLMLTEYIIYLALAVLFSMLQIILIRIGWNPHPLPAVISMTLMAVLGAAGLLFFFRELRTAAFRRLHM